MPLIDVVFLLLTFFIYAMVVLVQLKTSGLALASVEGSEKAQTDALVLVVLDRSGQVVIDGRVVPDDELDAELSAMAGRPDLPPVVLTVEAGEGEFDRVERYQALFGRIRRAGITEVRFPEFESGTPSGAPGE